MSSIVLTDEQVGDLCQDWRLFFRNHPGGAANCIRAIEQAVLQSTEVQAWKRDAERLDWLADPNNSIGNVQLPTECVTENLHSLRAAIDAAIRSEQ